MGRGDDFWDLDDENEIVDFWGNNTQPCDIDNKSLSSYTTKEKLDSINISEIEQYLRQKKLSKFTNKRNV